MRELLRQLLRPRLRRVDVAVAALLAALGFAVVVQVSATQSDGPLATARQEDLVQILDDLSNRDDRLRSEIAGLTATRERLTSGSGQAAAALAEARRRTQLLGVLAGTVPARGPGVAVTVTDPRSRVGASVLLDTVEELRDAGAEAMQVQGTGTGGTGTPVRVVAATSLVDDGGGVRVDGVLLRAPYRFVVLGDPPTLDAALGIAGGIVDTVQQQGGAVTVERLPLVAVTALRPLQRPRYARAVPSGS